ncbi:MAG: hypothetical protein H7138_08760 [Myxococcales bacterium]|nr:hypothetical protein [Myxococcales bacterium]
MSIRSMMLMLAVGTAGLATAAADPVEKTTNTGGGGFQCTNGVGVGCVGTIALLPITVNIKDVRVLNDNELTILSDDLNNLAILDAGILNYNTILNDVEIDVLADFLDKFDIDVTKNDINVCTLVLGLPLCK